MKNTRYVGGVRGPRTAIADHFEIKSLEGLGVLSTFDVEQLRPRGNYAPKSSGAEEGVLPRYVLVPCSGESSLQATAGLGYEQPMPGRKAGFQGRDAVCVFERNLESDGVIVSWADRDYAVLDRARKAFGSNLTTIPLPWHIERHYRKAQMNGLWRSQSTRNKKRVAVIPFATMRSELNAEQKDVLGELSDYTKGLQVSSYEVEKTYDIAIRSLGWRMDSSVFDDSLRVDVLEHGGFCDINHQAAVKQKRIKREAKEEEQRIWETLSAEGRRTQPQPIAPGEHFDNTHPCTRGQKTSPESVANIATDNRRKMQLEKLSGAELSSLLKIRGDSHKEGCHHESITVCQYKQKQAAIAALMRSELREKAEIWARTTEVKTPADKPWLQLDVPRAPHLRPGTYPLLTPCYESVSADGLYFAGANAHGSDRWRYSASGGFVNA